MNNVKFNTDNQELETLSMELQNGPQSLLKRSKHELYQQIKPANKLESRIQENKLDNNTI